MDIEINSDDKANLAVSIKNNIGNAIEFSNGCSISLKNDNSVYFGESLYGGFWCCNSDHDFSKAIMGWLKFWDDDRCEKGDLI